MQPPISKQLPSYIQKYAFDFYWDNTLLWKLNVPTETIDIRELVWHFDVPWLHSEGTRFKVTPAEVMRYPERYKKQYARTIQADLDYPIDIMFNKGNWLILDGLHRLMKSTIQGKSQVTVRKISQAMVPLIAR